MLRGLGPPILQRPRTEELQTPRPLKKLRSELAPVIQALKKPKVYLKVKCNYSFHIHMVSLMETLCKILYILF